MSVTRELAVAYFVKRIVERGFKESKCTTLYLSLTFKPCISINYPCIMLQKFKLSNYNFVRTARIFAKERRRGSNANSMKPSK